MIEIIISIVLSIISFVISICSFQEKGFLFNNAYLFASEQESKEMDKKPHYRQTAIVFCLLGIVFLIFAIELAAQVKWLIYLAIGILIGVMVYAVVSSMINLRKNR